MTAALFDHDQAENDRVLLSEEQRRQDLISGAVSSFAPHLAGQSGVKAVHVYTTNAALAKHLRESLGGARTIVVQHTLSGKKPQKGVNTIEQDGGQIWLDLPKRADLVASKSATNFKTELLAAHLGALPVILPEADDYVRARLKKQGVLVIVGADQGRK